MTVKNGPLTESLTHTAALIVRCRTEKTGNLRGGEGSAACPLSGAVADVAIVASFREKTQSSLRWDTVWSHTSTAAEQKTMLRPLMTTLEGSSCT